MAVEYCSCRYSKLNEWNMAIIFIFLNPLNPRRDLYRRNGLILGLLGGKKYAWKNKNEKNLQLEKVRTVNLTTLNQEQPTAHSFTIHTDQFEIVKRQYYWRSLNRTPTHWSSKKQI